MSGIELTLRHPYDGILDASSLLPEHLLTRELETIRRIPIDVGGRTLMLADIFSVASTASECLVVQGPVMLSYRWGAGMSGGHLIVECDVGPETGLAMCGGTLEIRGNVGDRLGSGMREGLIRVSGNAGDYVGAPTLGMRRGMRGGRITIDGNAGERLGDSMRRGTIVVLGNTGDYAASRMIAGTIAVCGQVGKHAGALMRRGTLWAPYISDSEISHSFTEPQRIDAPHLAIWYRWLATIDSRFLHWRHQPTITTRWLGDLSVQGLGEILSPALP